MDHDYFMRHALMLADRAASEGEVPVGAVLVQKNEIIAEGWNQPIQLHDPSAHAEMIAIRQAGQALSNYRLTDTMLYVTLEPCAMCVGAMIHARVSRLIFGAFDPKTGAVASAFSLLNDPKHNHQIIAEGGVLQEVCAARLKAFFREKRKSLVDL